MPLSFRARAALVALAIAFAVSPALPARDDVAAQVRLQLADLLYSEQRYADAADAYEQAREESTGAVRLRASVGLVKSLMRTGEFKRARSEGAALLLLQPDNAASLAVYGDALWAAGLFEEAEERYAEAAARSPDDARARSGLAKTLAARSQLDRALVEAQAAVALAPREGEFHFMLGYILERAKRFDEAAVSLRNYLNLLPNKEHSEKALWTGQQVRFLESFKNRPPLLIDDSQQNKVFTMPFTTVRDKIVVRGKVNGHSMDLILDTGAEMTVVTKNTAQRYGIDPVSYTLSAGVGQAGLRGLQIGRMDTLQIGDLKVKNVPTLIKNPPLQGLPTQEAESFSPLALGLSMYIDYKQRILTMGRTLPPQEYDVELPMRHHRLALVRGLINGGTPVHFVIDTGGEVISLSRATWDGLQIEPPRRIPLKVYGTSGWDPDAFLMTGLDLAFDRIAMPKQPMVVLNLDAPSALLGFELGGIVGHRFLSKYRVGIDLQRSVVGLDGN